MGCLRVTRRQEVSGERESSRLRRCPSVVCSSQSERETGPARDAVKQHHGTPLSPSAGRVIPYTRPTGPPPYKSFVKHIKFHGLVSFAPASLNTRLLRAILRPATVSNIKPDALISHSAGIRHGIRTLSMRVPRGRSKAIRVGYALGVNLNHRTTRLRFQLASESFQVEMVVRWCHDGFSRKQGRKAEILQEVPLIDFL